MNRSSVGGAASRPHRARRRCPNSIGSWTSPVSDAISGSSSQGRISARRYAPRVALEPNFKSMSTTREHGGLCPLPIGEVARRTGVPSSALRYYERIGLLPKTRRESGRRRYGEDVILQITLIQLARGAGFTLNEIRALFGDFHDPIRMGARFRAMAPRKVAELDEVIRRAESMKNLLEEGLRCQCLTLEACAVITRHMDR